MCGTDSGITAETLKSLEHNIPFSFLLLYSLDLLLWFVFPDVKVKVV